MTPDNRRAVVAEVLRTWWHSTYDPDRGACEDGADAVLAVLDKGEPRCGAFDPSLVALGDDTSWRDPLPRCTLERDHPSGWHSSDADGRILAQWRGPHNAAVLDKGEQT